MELHAVARGSGPTVVLVHGFTQTHESWHAVADDLAVDHEVVAVDAPGHGGSAGIDADLWASADLLARTTGPATYVGYSMGGRLALHLALAHPEMVDGLVLLGATAGIDGPGDRAERRADDEQLAAEIEQDGIDPFLERWLAQPIFEGLVADRVDLAARRANSPAGLASSLRLTGTGTMDPPLWDRLDEVTAPTLVVAGERDDKFRDLGARLASGIPGADDLVVLEDAGHAAHLERPGAFADLVRQWMRRRVT